MSAGDRQEASAPKAAVGAATIAPMPGIYPDRAPLVFGLHPQGLTKPRPDAGGYAVSLSSLSTSASAPLPSARHAGGIGGHRPDAARDFLDRRVLQRHCCGNGHGGRREWCRIPNRLAAPSVAD